MADWQGKPVPADEPPETVIRVWEVTGSDDERLIFRSWQRVLEHVSDDVEISLSEIEDVGHSITIKVRLREMTRAEYDDLPEE